MLHILSPASKSIALDFQSGSAPAL